MRAVGSTGAPLPPEGFTWIVDALGRPLPVGSVSGGTDVCTAFLQSCPLLPVRAGELQCAALGAKIEAYSEDGAPVVGEVGELVITRPLPSMPLYLWNDPDGTRYRESYFDVFPGVWRHGDWIRFNRRRFLGDLRTLRRDAQSRRRSYGNERTSTAIVEALPEIKDSLVVEVDGESAELVLFVVLAPDATLDDDLRQTHQRGAASRSSRRVMPPDRIIAVPEIPKTLNGKKLEIPVKRLLMGQPLAGAVSEGAVANPASLAAVVEAYREAAAARR